MITGENKLDTLEIVEVDSDPRLSINENLKIGSLALWNDGVNGKIFKKVGNNNLDYRELKEHIFFAYLSTNIDFFNTTPAICPFDVELLNQDTSVFSFDNLGSLTVLITALYEVSYDLGIDNTDTGRTNFRQWIEVNGVEVLGTDSFTYNRNNSQGKNSVSCKIPLNLNANDVVTVFSENFSGGVGNDGRFILNACRLQVKLLEA